MRINKTLGVGLVVLLLMSMVMVGVDAVSVAKFCVDIPCRVAVGGMTRLANVNITDVENLYSFEFKLAWNRTLLDLAGVNITSSKEWGTNYVIFKNETMQNYNGTHGRYWLNMSALAPAPSFNGSTIVAKLTFLVLFSPIAPMPDMWCRLNLYDTKLSNPEGEPILHEAYDDLFFLPILCLCTPWLEVSPTYYEATTLGENFTVSVEISIGPEILFTDWRAKLGYNTTLLDVIKVEEGPFLKGWREADERYFTASVNEEEGYVNVSGGVFTMCNPPYGYGSLAKITFNATYVAPCSENGTCLLDLYDTNLTSGWTSPIPHYVRDDGFYRAPHTKLAGDINDDGIVNIQDIVIVALAFGSRPGDHNWNPIADLNQDGIVNIVDIVMVAIHFGETC